MDYLLQNSSQHVRETNNVNYDKLHRRTYEEETDKYSRCVSRNRTQTLLGGQQTAALREGTHIHRPRAFSICTRLYCEKPGRLLKTNAHEMKTATRPFCVTF